MGDKLALKSDASPKYKHVWSAQGLSITFPAPPAPPPPALHPPPPTHTHKQQTHLINDTLQLNTHNHNDETKQKAQWRSVARKKITTDRTMTTLTVRRQISETDWGPTYRHASKDRNKVIDK